MDGSEAEYGLAVRTWPPEFLREYSKAESPVCVDRWPPATEPWSSAMKAVYTESMRVDDSGVET